MTHPNSIQVHIENLDNKIYRPQIQKIIAAYHSIGSATMHSIAKYLRVELTSISSRWCEMKRLGLIEETDLKHKRRTIFKLTKKGQEVANQLNAA